MVSKQTEDRLRILLVLVGIAFLLLIVRLVTLQLVQASDFQNISESNRVRMIPIRAPRGEILDRNGVVLARNKQVFSIVLTREPGRSDYSEIIRSLSGMLTADYPELTVEYIQGLLEQNQQRPYEPIVIKRNVDIKVATRIEELRQELSGVTVEVEPIRDYPGFGAVGSGLAGHVLGFVREISRSEMDERNQEAGESGYYQLGDLIGKDGLERQYEDQLRGRDGARRVEVDAHNRPLDNLRMIPATAGNNLTLTLDATLQEVLEKSMDETLTRLQRTGSPKAKAGAAVVIDVNTGGVLAMVSRPGLIPSDFVGTMSQERADFYYRSYPAAAINRAIAGTYPPGSTFKPVTALAALQAQAIRPETALVNCTGAYWLKPYIKCTGAHGILSLIRAMAVSCNTYFQEAGRLAGVDALVSVARQFGLGQKTGIDLPGESKGTLPDPQWKQRLNARLIDDQYNRSLEEITQRFDALLAGTEDPQARQELEKKRQREISTLEARYRINYNFHTTWQDFDTFNMSIGQGNNNYTPLQLAVYTAALANGGTVYQPFLVERIVSPSGETIFRAEPNVVNRVELDPRNLAMVTKGMQAVMEPGGTGYSLFSHFPAEVRVAGKTGTAQTGRQGDDRNRDFHGVFIAFAPADKPQLAFAGIIEYGYHGSTSSGYLAKAVFEEYFKITNKTEVQTAPESELNNEAEPVAAE